MFSTQTKIPASSVTMMADDDDVGKMGDVPVYSNWKESCCEEYLVSVYDFGSDKDPDCAVFSI